MSSPNVTTYYGIMPKHVNLEPTNLLWVGSSHEDGFDGPALYASVERIKEVFENEGRSLDDESLDIVEVVVTVQRPYE